MFKRTVSLALVSLAGACTLPASTSNDSDAAGPGSGSDAGAGSDSSTPGSDAGTGTDAHHADGSNPGDSSVASSCAPTSVIFGAAHTTKSTKDEPLLNNIAAADMNRDGKTDVVLLHGPTTSGGAGIEVFLSNGDGSFQAKFYDGHVGNGPGFAVADFDNDGYPDVVTSSFGDASVDDSIDLYLNKGDGTLGLPKNSSTNSSNLFAAAAADMNGDGLLDFVWQGQDQSGYVLNSGGNFGTPAPFQLGSGWSFGDVNGDGAADLAYIDSGKLCVKTNNGSGSAFAAPNCMPTADHAEITSVGDLNGDHELDIVVAYQGHSGTTSNNIAVHLNDGKGGFADRALYTYDSLFEDVRIVDVNNDGRGDFVTWSGTSSAAFEVLLANADGTLANTPLSYPAGGETAMASQTIVGGDFAGNGLRGLGVINSGANGFDVVVATCKK